MEPKHSKKARIAAMIAIVLLLSLYLIVIICTFIHHPLAEILLKAALFCTIIIPVLIYAFLICIRHFGPKDEANPPKKDSSKK